MSEIKKSELWYDRLEELFSKPEVEQETSLTSSPQRVKAWLQSIRSDVDVQSPQSLPNLEIETKVEETKIEETKIEERKDESLITNSKPIISKSISTEPMSVIKCPSCGHVYDLPTNTTVFICVHCFNKYSLESGKIMPAGSSDLYAGPFASRMIREKPIPWYKRLFGITR